MSASVHHVEFGDGTPVVALHGAGVDHRELESALEPMFARWSGYRRIYPDLPGHGRSPADGLASNDDVVARLCAFLDEVIGDRAVLLLGHSYGAYLARGVAARVPQRVAGLALVCPVGETSGDVPEQSAVRVDGDPCAELAGDQIAGYEAYFVVRTPQTARRYRDHVVPGTKVVDGEGFGRIAENWRIDIGAEPCDAPTLIVAGRRDSTAGHTAAYELLPNYPAATFVAVGGAGHALHHEQPELLAGLVDDWLRRVAIGRAGLPSSRG